MSNNLAQIVFDQFLGLVEKFAKHSCFEFDPCSFDYTINYAVRHTLLEVIYTACDCCNRTKTTIATIDITNICPNYLVTCKWVNYLETIAQEYVYDICPKKWVLVKEEHKKCRNQPQHCKPFPCKITTVVTEQPPHECDLSESEEVIEEFVCAPCKPCCKREPCPTKKQLIIRHQPAQWLCGDFTVPVQKPAAKDHDFGSHKGLPDFNDHKWNKACCGPCSSCH